MALGLRHLGALHDQPKPPFLFLQNSWLCQNGSEVTGAGITTVWGGTVIMIGIPIVSFDQEQQKIIIDNSRNKYA